MTKEILFKRSLKLLKEKKQEKLLSVAKIDFRMIEGCLANFVLPFIDTLSGFEEISKQPLWNIKDRTNQFFVVLNALLMRLADNIELNKQNEEPMDYPFSEGTEHHLWNIILVATTWSFGAVLNKEGRRIFDESFAKIRTKSKFNIQFN